MQDEEFLSTIADSVDRRREEISLVQRVVAEVSDTTLEQTAAIMALPMLYAHWEGFVKEVIGEYLEFLERSMLAPANTHPTVFSFAMRKKLNLIVKSGSLERITEFAAWVISTSAMPVAFEDKQVRTGGNLSFSNLKDLCDELRISVDRLASQKRKIDSLVHKRNNIPHTGRPPQIDKISVDEDAVFVMHLIETFESIMKECIEMRMYLSSAA